MGVRTTYTNSTTRADSDVDKKMNFEQSILRSVMVYTIHYIGAKWCSTCKTIKPATEEIAKRFAIPLVQYDFDGLTEEEKGRITKVPTIRIFEENTQIVEWNVSQVKSLEAWLQTYVKMTNDDF